MLGLSEIVLYLEPQLSRGVLESDMPSDAPLGASDDTFGETVVCGSPVEASGFASMRDELLVATPAPSAPGNLKNSVRCTPFSGAMPITSMPVDKVSKSSRD